MRCEDSALVSVPPRFEPGLCGAFMPLWMHFLHEKQGWGAWAAGVILRQGFFYSTSHCGMDTQSQHRMWIRWVTLALVRDRRGSTSQIRFSLQYCFCWRAIHTGRHLNCRSQALYMTKKNRERLIHQTKTLPPSRKIGKYILRKDRSRITTS